MFEIGIDGMITNNMSRYLITLIQSAWYVYAHNVAILTVDLIPAQSTFTRA